jgi:energy-coupling factor transporter ATP-binding protein EcfA2
MHYRRLMTKICTPNYVREMSIPHGLVGFYSNNSPCVKLLMCYLGINRHVGPESPLKFHDTGRYAEIMSNTRDEIANRCASIDSDWNLKTLRDNRTPSLVSFVGQSGAGKSTLINLLVAIKGNSSQVDLPTPVVGMTGKDVPTSEDVHLYSDPGTITSDSPLLFADCEGLDGGERKPVGTRFREARHDFDTRSSRMHQVTQPSSRTQYSSERDILWADTPSRRSRQFAVTHLYPRLLYTFSDTIVFVLKNPR